MDRLNALETFVAALDEGSFNRASKRRNVSQAAISQQIRSLETLLNQELLLRSPSGVRATAAGKVVYDKARILMSNYRDLEDSIESLRDSLSGTFRVSAAAFLGRTLFGPALVDLNTKHPELDLVIKLEDRLVNVVSEAYDLAIRSGPLGDTDGVARKAGTLRNVLFATPDYLAKHGTPQTPHDLTKLKCVCSREAEPTNHLELTKGNQHHSVEVPIAMTLGSPELILRAVSQGAGFSRGPTILIREALDSGAFVEILPDYDLPPKNLHLIVPSHKTSTRQRDLVIDTLRAAMAASPDVELTSGFSEA